MGKCVVGMGWMGEEYGDWGDEWRWDGGVKTLEVLPFCLLMRFGVV